jgi:hypothetical protein
MRETDADPTEEPTATDLLMRPPATLSHVPLPVVWEFTRRHPYYLQFWQWAHRYHAKMFGDERERAWAELCAQFLLATLGVSGDPPPPSATAEVLGMTGLDGAWVGRAVAPTTFRTMTALMLDVLPRDAKLHVAVLLAESAGAHGDDGGPPDTLAKLDLLTRLRAIDDVTLDAVPDAPIIALNLRAPQRSIARAVEGLVREWKGKRKIGERRRRDEALGEYLRVWDLREGWAGDHYVVANIAEVPSKPVSTVATRYRSAFHLISGHPYDFAAWTKLFRANKLAAPSAPASIGRRRSRMRSRADGRGEERPRSVRAVPESIIARDGDGSFVDRLATVGPAEDDTLLSGDIADLIGQRYADHAIVRKLGLKGDEGSMKLIRYLRKRAKDDATR